MSKRLYKRKLSGKERHVKNWVRSATIRYDPNSKLGREWRQNDRETAAARKLMLEGIPEAAEEFRASGQRTKFNMGPKNKTARKKTGNTKKKMPPKRKGGAKGGRKRKYATEAARKAARNERARERYALITQNPELRLKRSEKSKRYYAKRRAPYRIKVCKQLLSEHGYTMKRPLKYSY